MLEAGQKLAVGPDDDAAVVAVDQDRFAVLDAVANVVEAAGKWGEELVLLYRR